MLSYILHPILSNPHKEVKFFPKGETIAIQLPEKTHGHKNPKYFWCIFKERNELLYEARLIYHELLQKRSQKEEILMNLRYKRLKTKVKLRGVETSKRIIAFKED